MDNTLQGGAGNDTYEFFDAYAHDVIDDSDGEGSVVIDGTTVAGGFVPFLR